MLIEERFVDNMLVEEKFVDAMSDPESDGEPSQLDTRSTNKALAEFRLKVEEAIAGGHLLASKSKSNKKFVMAAAALDFRLWGVTLFPGKGQEATDGVLGKFLKAKRYKVSDAFKALKKTMKWRADFRPDDFAGEEQRDNVWFRSGVDMEGRPLCYSILGKEYQKRLASVGEHSYHEYLRWRVLCIEKGIQNLNFRRGGVDSIVQIIDMRNAGGAATKEMKLIGRKMISLLHDHYPGIVYKNLIINAPAWFLTLNALHLRVIAKRSKNRFIFVKTSKVTETLLKYAFIENILVQYGGLMRENDIEFSSEDKVLEANIRGNSTEFIQIPLNEAGVTVTWDITVVGYEVMYREEFVPEDDCSYKILLQEKRMGEGIRNSFYIREPGKIVISITNASYTKKKAFYRYKTRPMYSIYN